MNTLPLVPLIQTDAQKADWLAARHLEYHARQFTGMYRSTVHLKEFVQSVLDDRNAPHQALDVCCGAGANIFHLSRIFPQTNWTGVDMSPELLELGRKLIADNGGITNGLQLLEGDLYRLPETCPPDTFDLVFCLQTLSWLPSYEEAMPALLQMARPGGGVVFVTSLFTDSLVDARIEITQYDEGDLLHGTGRSFYNVYCMDKFRDYCLKIGAKEVISSDFNIDVDLPVPDHRRMGTFTVATQAGRRLQISGPLLLPWKFVAIRT